MKTSPGYFGLEIEATSPDTDIWLGDGEGYLVTKAVGKLEVGLLPGHYMVEFVLGGTCYPINLHEHQYLKQHDIEAGPTCHRRAVAN